MRDEPCGAGAGAAAAAAAIFGGKNGSARGENKHPRPRMVKGARKAFSKLIPLSLKKPDETTFELDRLRSRTTNALRGV